MRRRTWIGALLFGVIAGGLACAGEPPSCEPGRPGILQRVGPVGGWSPYGGGLLRWWDPHCFPPCSGPDDYCRKPLPCVCWPAYPSYYIWDPRQEPVGGIAPMRPAGPPALESSLPPR